MKKSAFYFLVFIGFNVFLFALASWVEKDEVLMEADGFKFIKVSPQELVAKAQKNTVFLIDKEKTQTTEIYKIASQHSSNKPSKVQMQASPLGLKNDEQLIKDAVNGTINFTEALSLDYEGLKKLVVNAPNVTVMQAIQPIPKSDIFAQLDDSAFIFIFFGLVASVILSFYEGIVYGIKRLTSRNWQPAINILMLIVVCTLLYQGSTPNWYAASHLAAWLEIALLLFASYFLFQWVKKQLNEPNHFFEGATRQFILLFLCIAGMAFLGTEVARWVDAQFFDASSYTGLAMRAKLHLYIGFGYAFALGNLLKNSVVYWWTNARVNTSL